MAELHTSVYLKHSVEDTHAVLKELFHIFKNNESDVKATFLDVANKVSEKDSSHIVEEFLTNIEALPGNLMQNLATESIDLVAGYHCLDFVHGGWGDEVIPLILKLLKTLNSDIEIRAWTYGDDDPWEIIYGYKDGKLFAQYFEPEMDDYFDYEEEERTDEELPDVYKWWHKDLPDEIKEGFINEWIDEWEAEKNEPDWENEYIVLTGKFENYESREELKEEIEDYGATVQSAVNKKTTILVTGLRVGATKIEKAKKLGVKIMKEEELLKYL